MPEEKPIIKKVIYSIIQVIGVLFILAVVLFVVSYRSYSYYEYRTITNESYYIMKGLQGKLSFYYKENKKWPHNIYEIAPSIPEGRWTDKIQILTKNDTNGTIVIQSTFKGLSGELFKGKTFSISSNDGGVTWQCGLNATQGTSLIKELLPTNCR